MSNIIDILQTIITNKISGIKIYSEIATVISVDEDNMSAEVSFVSSNADKTVRLGATISEDTTALTASSILLLPEIDSNVLVTFINETTGFISSVTDVSKVLYKVGDRYIQTESDFIEMDGDADFMVRYSVLETAYNTLKSDFNTFISIFNAHVHPGVTAGAASTLVTPTTGSVSSGDISGAKIDEIKTS